MEEAAEVEGPAALFVTEVPLVTASFPLPFPAPFTTALFLPLPSTSAFFLPLRVLVFLGGVVVGFPVDACPFEGPTKVTGFAGFAIFPGRDTVLAALDVGAAEVGETSVGDVGVGDVIFEVRVAAARERVATAVVLAAVSSEGTGIVFGTSGFIPFASANPVISLSCWCCS